MNMKISENLKKIEAAFRYNGFNLRIVGGAVRDHVLGFKPKDIDLCTDATPDEMINICFFNSFKAIPSGIEHGTVTIRVGSEQFEITTLRSDVNTDGRHAKVEFVRNFQTDAARRDFTMNAMSMDFEGNIFDYFNGIEDIKNKEINFVGNAVERIREDYLRILRFFRFATRLNFSFNPYIFSAIRTTAPGLKTLSGERIWLEMSKILANDNTAKNGMLFDMYNTDVLENIGLADFDLTEFPKVAMNTGNPVSRLAAMAKTPENFNKIADAWKLTNKDRDLGNFILTNLGMNMKSAKTKLVNKSPKKSVIETLKVSGSGDTAEILENWNVPVFPINGKDLISLGIPPGKSMGIILHLLKDAWIESDFRLTKENLMNKILMWA